MSSSPHYPASSQAADVARPVQTEFRPARPEDLHIKGFVHEVSPTGTVQVKAKLLWCKAAGMYCHSISIFF